MGGPNFLYDEKNNFGNLTSAGDFPNTINMGEASAERMSVDLKLPDGPITGSVTLSITGSDTENGTYDTIVTGGSVSGVDIANDGYGLPMPKTKFKFLKASLAGSFVGTVQAIINSYIGK